MFVLVLLTLSVLLVLNYSVRCDFRYPPVLMSMVWLIAMTLYFVGPLEIDRIGVLTVLIFVSAILAFSGGGYLALALCERSEGTQLGGADLLAPSSTHPRLKRVFLILSIAMLPLLIVKAFQLASQSDAGVL